MDTAATDVVVQDPEPQTEFKPEHLAPGKYTSHQGYEYIICDKTDTGCDDCYRTKTIRVIHHSDIDTSVHFFMPESTEMGTRMRHYALLNPCSYRQVRINTNDSVEHRSNPQF